MPASTQEASLGDPYLNFVSKQFSDLDVAD